MSSGAPSSTRRCAASCVDDQLAVRGDRVAYCGPAFPASGDRAAVRHRAASTASSTRTAGSIGTVDEGRAFDSVHPGAVYLHQGQHFRVHRLDLDDRAAWVDAADGAEWTEARTVTDLTDRHARTRIVRVGRASLSIGNVEVSQQVDRLPAPGRGERGGPRPCRSSTCPPTRLATRAFWYTIHDDVLDDAGSRRRTCPGRCTRPSTPAIGMLPLFTICDRWDVGGVSTAVHPQTGRGDDLHLRRLRRRRGHRRARVRVRAAAPRRHAGGDRRLPLRGRVPVVRAVAQVRQLERAPGQARRHRRSSSVRARWLSPSSRSAAAATPGAADERQAS